MGIEDFLRQFLQGQQEQQGLGGLGGLQDVSHRFDPMEPDMGVYPGGAPPEDEELSLWELFKSGESEGAPPGLNAYSQAPDMSQMYATGQIPGLMAVRPQEQFAQQDPFRSLMSFMGGGRQ